MPAAFISYSRRDRDAVQRLHDALIARDYEVWVDWEDIPPSAEWFAEIRSGIGGADGFVYVISPDSVASEVCGRELHQALELNKRVVPVVVRDADTAAVPEAAGALNWVFLRDSDDFDAGVASLTAALETDLDHVRTHTRIGVEAGRWEQSGRDSSQLLRGTDLAQAEAWLAAGAGLVPEATALQRAFLLAGRQAATRRQRTILGAVTVALVVAVVLSVVALVQRSSAIHARDTAQARLLDSEAQGQYATDPEVSVILAARAARSLPDAQSTYALRAALLQSRVRTQIALGGGQGGDALWSPDGRRLLLTSPGHWARLYARGAARPLATLPAPVGAGMSAWAAHGDRVVVGGSHPAVYDGLTGRRLRDLPVGALSVGLNATGTIAATGNLGNAGHAVDVDSGSMLATFHVPGAAAINCFALSPDGSLVAAGGLSNLNPSQVDSVHGTIAVFTVHGGRLVRLIHTFTPPGSLSFSPDGRRIMFTTTTRARAQSAAATADAVGQPGVWIYAARGSAGPLQTFPGSASAAVFGPGGQIAYARTVGTVPGADNPGGDPVYVVSAAYHRSFTMLGATDTVRTLEFAPGGGDLLTAGDDGVARIYDTARDGTPFITLAGHTGPITSASLDPLGELVATSSDDGSARLWQGLSPAASANRPGQDGAATTALLSAHGDRALVTGGAAGPGTGQILSGTLTPLVRFHAPAGQAFVGARWPREDAPITAVSGPATPNGIVARQAETFSPSTGAMRAVLRPSGAAGFTDFSVSPDGRTGIGVQADGRLPVFDLTAGRRRYVLRGPDAVLGYPAFTRDGRLLAVPRNPPLPAHVGSLTRYGHVSIDLWDLRLGRLRRTITGPTLSPQTPGTKDYAPLTVAFSTDGRTVALAGADSTVRVYDVASGRLLRTLSLAGGAEGDYADSLQFSPDGGYLVAGAAIGAYVWRLPGFTRLPAFTALRNFVVSVTNGYGMRAAIVGGGHTLFIEGDATAEAWSVADHQQVLHVYPAAAGSGMDLDGTRLLVASGGGLSTFDCVLCGGLPRLRAAARGRITRPLTPAERQRFLSAG